MWLASYGTCETRRRALAESGRDVRALSFTPYMERLGQRLGNLQQKLGFGPGIRAYNRALVTEAIAYRPDIVWIDKGTLVLPQTLRELRRRTGALLVHYNTDDIAFANHYWHLHLSGIPEYDVYFTTNAANIEELRRRGARSVVETRLGYDRDLFFPRAVDGDDSARLGADIGFIGSWEPAKERWLAHLAAAGLSVRVRGNMWQNCHDAVLRSRIGGPTPIFDDEYAKAIAATKINIGLVSAQNRSQSSGRSFEIPAAGGFLLALRTPEHRALYEEGREAEFFQTPEELVAKARYYLAHDDERRAIAEEGTARCRRSGYSWQDRMAAMSAIVEAASARG